MPVGAAVIGVDASAAMLAAVEPGPDAALVADAAMWQPDIPVALIVSKAALHRVPDRDRPMMPRRAGAFPVPPPVLHSEGLTCPR